MNSRRTVLGALLGATTLSGWSATATTGAPTAARQRPLALSSAAMDLCAAGPRLVAVGERGHVLLSDDQGKAWRQAKAVPTRTLLTAVYASSPSQLWAAGHGGVLLRSDDAGEHWQAVAAPSEAGDVWLSLRVEAAGPAMVVGGFGAALRSSDGGATWQRTTLLEGEAGEKHLNKLFVSAAGTWLVAAEGGTLLRSSDQGQHWQAHASPYKGSLWGGAEVGPAGQSVLLACGMRGNWVRSKDDGLSWTAQQIAGAGSLTSVATFQGQVALVGVDGTLAVGRADAAQFQLMPLQDRASLHGAWALDTRTLAVASATGPRTVAWPSQG